MAQNPLKGSHSEQLEIEEIDESKNIVARYITSAPGNYGSSSRIDVLVNISWFLSPFN
jgi:hypothetical protein